MTTTTPCPRWLLAVALLAAAPVSRAQDAPEETFGEEALTLTEDGGFLIEGKVQKPEVVVVISRENLSEGIDLRIRESFLPKILEALEKEPF